MLNSSPLELCPAGVISHGQAMQAMPDSLFEMKHEFLSVTRDNPADPGALVMGPVFPGSGSHQNIYPMLRLTRSRGTHFPVRRWLWGERNLPNWGRFDVPPPQLADVWRQRPAWARCVSLESSHPFLPFGTDHHSGDRYISELMFDELSPGVRGLWVNEGYIGELAEEQAIKLRTVGVSFDGILCDDETRCDPYEISRKGSPYGPGALDAIVADPRFDELWRKAGIPAIEKPRFSFTGWVSARVIDRWLWSSLMNARVCDSLDLILRWFTPRWAGNASHSLRAPAVVSTEKGDHYWSPPFGVGVLPQAAFSSASCVKLYGNNEGMIAIRAGDYIAPYNRPVTRWGAFVSDVRRVVSARLAATNWPCVIVQCNHLPRGQADGAAASYADWYFTPHGRAAVLHALVQSGGGPLVVSSAQNVDLGYAERFQREVAGWLDELREHCGPMGWTSPLPSVPHWESALSYTSRCRTLAGDEVSITTTSDGVTTWGQW